MIYLTGVANRWTDLYCKHYGYDWQIGLLAQPGTRQYLKRASNYPFVGLDNGCYSPQGRERFAALGLQGYLDLIVEFSEATCDDVLFATAPDVVGDWKETLKLSLPALPLIAGVTRAAIVAQDGITEGTVPWDMISCLFIGGTNEFKDSRECRLAIDAAKKRGKFIHWGRCNSLSRFEYAARVGADSADGTYVKHRQKQVGDQLVPLIEIAGWSCAVNGPDPEMTAAEVADWKAGLYQSPTRDDGDRQFDLLTDYLTLFPEITMAKRNSVKVPAIKYQQGGHTLYSFVLDARLIHSYAKVSLLQQDEEGNVQGFQREEITAHIKDITNFLNSDNPFIPNSIVIGFQKAPTFSAVDKEAGLGMLTLSGDNALIVDGQQRTRAIVNSTLDSFPMNCVGFVAEGEEELREAFIRVNSGKPLKKSILHALLPGIEATINASLARDRFPVILIDRLNRDADSPLAGRIKTTLNPSGFISEGAVEWMIKQSLSRNGYLFSLTGDEDMGRMLTVLKNFWAAVEATWPKAWDVPPAASRLTHAAGVAALGHLMDQIGNDVSDPEGLTKAAFATALRKLKKVCHWTEGSGDWNLAADGVFPWDGIQNTGKGKSMLMAYLNREYRKTRLDKETEEEAA